MAAKVLRTVNFLVLSLYGCAPVLDPGLLSLLVRVRQKRATRLKFKKKKQNFYPSSPCSHEA